MSDVWGIAIGFGDKLGVHPYSGFRLAVGTKFILAPDPPFTTKPLRVFIAPGGAMIPMPPQTPEEK